MYTGHTAEVLIVNGIGIFLMFFLYRTIIENNEKHFASDRIFDAMIWLTIGGCLAEALSFVVDGRLFTGDRLCSYLLNSFCFVGTCTLGFLWCLYVDLRSYNNLARTRKKAGVLAIPLMINLALDIVNLGVCGIVFSISEQNVYERGSLVWVAYVTLFLYFFYSIFLSEKSKRQGFRIRFFPIYYFMVPCIIGTIVQGLVYGVPLGWTSVAITLVFTYIQIQARNTFVDSLSGLYNRRYLDSILRQHKSSPRFSVGGIMIDVNDFKRINDKCGHSAGDQAIRDIGQILSESLPENGIAFRYAGDEFIVLLRTEGEKEIKETMERIRYNTRKVKAASDVDYDLSFAMGYSKFDPAKEDIEIFLTNMDASMYADKKRHYEQYAATK